VRGTTHEIAIDAETMRGEIAFYAVPRLAVNDKSPRSSDKGLSLCMAGARDVAQETTVVGTVVRKPLVWNGLRHCA